MSRHGALPSMLAPPPAFQNAKTIRSPRKAPRMGSIRGAGGCGPVQGWSEASPDSVTAPRPIKLTFIEGEGRDLAFQNQERQRRLAAKSKSPKKPDPPPEAIPDQTLARLTSAMSLDSIARGLSVAFIKEDARDDDDEASRVEARHTALPWCSVSCLGADLQVLETPDATLRYDL